MRHPGLRVVPDRGHDLVVAGALEFTARGPNNALLEDDYGIEIRVQPGFPKCLPTVKETGARIANSFHKLTDGSLCIGAPTALRLLLEDSPSIFDFVERAVVPYLFGHTYFIAYGEMPFGELAHSVKGLLEHFQVLFRARDHVAARDFVLLASLRRRQANKMPCACGSNRRLGQCHNTAVNEMRALLGRSWFAHQHRIFEDERRQTNGGFPDV